jgi:hypothetical protein
MLAAMRRASSRVPVRLASWPALFNAVLNRQQLFSERHVRIQRYFNLAKRVKKGGPRRHTHRAEALCGQSALRPWELGGVARPQLKLSSPRDTRGDYTMLMR